jgi:hypothetical protein
MILVSNVPLDGGPKVVELCLRPCSSGGGGGGDVRQRVNSESVSSESSSNNRKSEAATAANEENADAASTFFNPGRVHLIFSPLFPLQTVFSV